MFQNKIHKEDNIAEYLDSLANQQAYHSSTHQFFTKTRRRNNREHSFNNISDWNNLQEIEFENHLQFPHLNRKELYRQRSVDGEHLPKYKSQLLKSPYPKRYQQNMQNISPKTYQFNSRIFSKTPKKSKLFFHKVFHLDDRQKLQMTLRLKKKQGSWPTKPKDIDASNQELNNHLDQKYSPRTERNTGILRMLKRRQQIKKSHKNKQAPDALKGIKFKY